jgi:hypothetical protein
MQVLKTALVLVDVRVLDFPISAQPANPLLARLDIYQ